MIKRRKKFVSINDSCNTVVDEVIEVLKRQEHISRLDDESWKEDMNWDARQYEADKEAENDK